MAAAAQPALAQLQASFRDTLRDVIGLSQQQTNHLINNEEIDTAEELMMVQEETMLAMFPERRQAINLKGKSKTRLIVFRNWIIKTKNTSPDAPVDPTLFTAPLMQKLCTRYASSVTSKEDKSNTTNVKLGSFNGKTEDWDDKKEEFIAFLSLQRNQNNVPLSYLVRNDDDRPDDEDMTELDEDIYDTPMHGNTFNNDNWTFFNYLTKWTIHGPAKTHVQKYESTHDGRSAWLDLISDFEAINTRHIKIMAARKMINDAHWTEDLPTFTFQEYCNRHIKANNTLERYAVAYDGPSQVQHFLNGIKKEAYVPIKSQILSDDVANDDLQRAIEKFKEQLVRLFHYPKKQKTKEFRKIGKASTSADQKNTNKRQKTDDKSSKSHSNSTKQTDDAYNIPQEVLAPLNSFQRKMMYMGRDLMRKDAANYQGNDRRNNRGQNISSVQSDHTPGTDHNKTNDNDSTLPSTNQSQGGASSMFGQRNRNLNNRDNNSRQQGAVVSGPRTIAKIKSSPTSYDYDGRYRLEIDSRADTTCVGRGFVPLRDTGNVCTVTGFHQSMKPVEDVPIRTCATAFDHPNGNTYILEIGQCLWFGNSLEHSLLSPNQVRSFGHSLCLTPKQFSNGTSMHGIKTDDDIELSFNLFGCISYLPIRTPTDKELSECIHICLTSEDKWEPYSDDFAAAERPFQVSATSSHHHRSNVSPETLARRWGTSIETAQNTLQNTYQRGFRVLDGDLSRRFRTRQTHMRYRYLRTNVYSDTLHSETTSARKNDYAQLFVTDQDFAEIYPMRNESDAPYTLDSFCKTYGLPKMLITDNARAETLGEWGKVVKHYLLTQTTTEPHSGWQNRAEIEIRELKKHFRRIMHRARCPEVFWDYGLEYTSNIRKLTARRRLDWRTPYEILTGDTPDCTEYLNFDFFGWVKYKHPEKGVVDDVHLARWLGVAHNVGQAMVYWLLKSNGNVIARSTVRPLTDEELRSDVEKQARQDYMKELKEKVGDFDPNLINIDPETTVDEAEQPLTVDGDPVGNEEFTEFAEDPNAQMDDEIPGPELLINAEIMLPHGDRSEIAKVIGRKRNADGNFIGRKHSNPILDSRIFIVRFPDGTEKDISYNILAEHLFSQVDSEGKQYRLFKEIINHRKNNRAVDKRDATRVDHRTGKVQKKKTTAGWELEVEWKDGSTSWLPLKELKETNAVEVAQYAMNNRIDDEPAFDWWVKHVLKKLQRLIGKTQSHHQRQGYKFGIKIPRTVEEALALDKENGNTFWYDAIMKEMKNVRIAFNILDDKSAVPIGYKWIPCHMIFDIKMDFTRKARLVAGGHLTDPPATTTYSSVVSRESVRIAFVLAALNGLEILAADIGNAYLNAPTAEKVYTNCGTEFGDDAGKVAIIVRALYGLKSSGAAWHDFFANSLTDLNFSPCRSDPDVWRRAAEKSDGTPYYEYILVYVDDCLVVSANPQAILSQLESDYQYRLKDVGPPRKFLGAVIRYYRVDSFWDEPQWMISADFYLDEALAEVEARWGKNFDKNFSGKRDTPAPPKFHPELDDTDFLDADLITLYQSYIGVLRWAVELGRIDLAHFASTMAKFSAAPREGHLYAVLRGFAYIKKHSDSCIVIDVKPRDYSFMEWTSSDWTRFYPDITEELLPYDMPEPRGKPVQISLFCDASHATDLVTRRSTTGFVFMLMGTPIHWYSKRQTTIESSVFGSEFVALKIAVEANEALRYKLRMFGVPIDGTTNTFCDNESVVTNVMYPESTLQKKHNAVAYHKTRESVASGAIRIRHEKGKDNMSDVLTKFLDAESHFKCCRCMLYRGGD